MGVSIRRRQADLGRLRALADANPGRVEITSVEGEPPTVFRVRLACRSMVALAADGTVRFGTSHTLRILLGERYPLDQPLVYVETPVANPHVFPSTGRICLGTAWAPGEMLDVFVQRLWSILVWDPAIIDPGSPANVLALRWSEAHTSQLPLDPARLAAAGATPTTRQTPHLLADRLGSRGAAIRE